MNIRGLNDGRWKVKKKRGKRWKSAWIGKAKMQMVAFMLITVICFFMPLRTRPEWGSGQLSACSALITVRRSFIWRTFIYSFNFLSFMCSARTPHSSDTGVCRLECTAHFWLANVFQAFITFHVWMVNCILLYFGTTGRTALYIQRV